MEQEEFTDKYVDVLKAQPFTLFPSPDFSRAPSIAEQWLYKKLVYVADSKAFIVIGESSNPKKTYNISLALIEFVIPGVLRLTRALVPTNGDLV
jgi:hypothetical protein